MRRLLFAPAALLLTLALAGTALAANAHLIGSVGVSTSGNTLTITASIAGLGNVPTATFNLSGTVDVSSRCYTRKGNTPQAANKQESITVDSDATFPVKNGRTDVSFAITPLSTLTCPGGQHVVVESISYDLAITGEGVNIPVP
jgi:hypothetical protein